MFETIKNFLVSNWKKLLASIAAALLAFVLLKYVVAPFLGLTVVSVAGALVAGWLVWSKVAFWEIEQLAAKAGIKL